MDALLHPPCHRVRPLSAPGRFNPCVPPHVWTLHLRLEDVFTYFRHGHVHADLVGKEEVFGSGKKADSTAKLPCMDWLRKELSCAVRRIHFVMF
jgi:hypothetical protein